MTANNFTAKPFYTYAHFMADSIARGPFYIGKGQASRAWTHKSRTKHWRQIVAKHGLHVEIIAEFDDEQCAYQNECEMIAFWRKNGATLINLTDGGEGLRNPSPEVREQISSAAKAQWNDTTRRDLLLKVRSSNDALRRKSESLKRAFSVPGSKERRSAALKAAKSTPESVARRQQLAASPEYRAKLSQGVKDAHRRPEVVANKSAASKRRWEDPEYRAKREEIDRERSERLWADLSEEDRERRRRKAENRRRLKNGGTPMTKAEASALAAEARRKKRSAA